MDWSGILDAIHAAKGKQVEVSKPPHLSILQTRNKILDLAYKRAMCVDYCIVMGHLYVWRDS